MRFMVLYLATFASTAVAETFDRPIPQAQSATAEHWFAGASLALVIALIIVHRLVMRK